LGQVGSGVGIEYNRVGGCAVGQAGDAETGPGVPGCREWPRTRNTVSAMPV
jgi:hypothetical protein